MKKIQKFLNGNFLTPTKMIWFFVFVAVVLFSLSYKPGNYDKNPVGAPRQVIEEHGAGKMPE